MLSGVVLWLAGVPRPRHTLEETVIVELDVAGYTTGVVGGGASAKSCACACLRLLHAAYTMCVA